MGNLHFLLVRHPQGCLNSRSSRHQEALVSNPDCAAGEEAQRLAASAAAPRGDKLAPHRFGVWPLGLALCGLVLAGCVDPATRDAKPEVKPVPAAPTNSTPVQPTPVQSAAPPSAAPKPLLPPEAAKPPAPFVGEGWESLFDGKTLNGWAAADFVARGPVECVQNVALLRAGDPLTGINYTNPLPKMNYEVALDAMRVSGSDFFCALTVPVKDDFCTLIVGGWGGGLVGISSLEGMDASENQTTKFLSFDQGRWYRIRMRVTKDRLEAWIDQDKVVDVVTVDKKISLRPGEIEMSKPFGIASYMTTAALREIKLRRVDTPADPAKRQRD